MRSVDLKEFVSGFVAEADDHLRAVKSNLVELDRAVQAGRSNPRAIRELFRSFHTIKGLAAMVGVEPIAELAHAVETLLRNADRAGGLIQAERLEALITAAQAVEQRVGALAGGQAVESAPEPLFRALEAADLPAASSVPSGALPGLEPALDAKLTAAEREQIAQGLAAGQRPMRVDFVPSAEKSEAGVNITAVRERVGALAEIVRVLPLTVPGVPGSGLCFALIVLTRSSPAELAEAAHTEQERVTALVTEHAPPSSLIPEPSEEDEAGIRGRVVRVPVERLDDALENLSVLVVQRYRLERAAAELAARGTDVRELSRALAEQGRDLRKLRASILGLRLVDVSEMLEPLPLLVRGLKRATGKSVRLEIDQTRAQLDKAVAERVLPAVVHLVRNAVDHAIETPERRRAAGKPEEGVVRITCLQRGDSQLELSVADDGRGIDAEFVARRAGRPVPQTNSELLALLAEPGFTTREQVTQTSGRGLGVDIVLRTVVQGLGGDLLLETGVGRGSRFTLRIPLTMTIVDALAFECGAQPFVVPIAMVEEIIEVEPAAVKRGPAPDRTSRNVGLIERRGEVVPLIALWDALGSARSGGDMAPAKALLVRQDGVPLAFGVDRMLGQKEVVVRPMTDPLVQVVGVTGSTDLGDGVPTLVVDLLALSRVVGGKRQEVPA